MTKNRTPTPVYLDTGMHPGLEVKGLRNTITILSDKLLIKVAPWDENCQSTMFKH